MNDKNMKKIILINFIIVLITSIIYAIQVEVVSLAAVLGEYHKTSNLLEIVPELNKSFNLSILFQTLIYAIFQIISFKAFTSNNKKSLKYILILNLVVYFSVELLYYFGVNSVILNSDIGTLSGILLAAIFNIIIYISVLTKIIKLIK